MAAKLSSTYLGRLMVAWMTVSGMMASDYYGVVKSNGLVVPGATVMAVQADRKIVTTTDDRGGFSLPDPGNGAWRVEIEMLGFGKVSREVRATAGTTAAEWELKLLSQEALAAQVHSSASRVAARQPVRFRQLSVSQSTATAALGSEGTIKNEEVADLSQKSANAFLVQGSVSSALGLTQQNDWGLGPRGMDPMGGPGMMGMGGDDRGPGARGPSDGPPAAARMAGGGPPPGPPPGGGGGPDGGPGGPGGPPMGRESWQGRRNAMVFGNARKDPRSTYMGSVFFSLGNSALDTRSFSVTGASVDKPSYANARGGIMFGGPLQIPKLINKDKKIFFSINFDMQRNRTGTVSDAVKMPTDLERTGDFSQNSSTAIYDPTTGTPFPNNKIPASRINSTATALLKYYPTPNLAETSRNYQTSYTGSNNSYRVNARLSNIKPTSKDRLFGGIGYQGGDSVAPNLFQFTDSGSNRAMNINLGWSRNITTRLTNTVQYSFSRNRQQTTPYFAYRENVAEALGISGTSQNPMNWGPPSLSLTNYAGLTDGNASLSRNQTSSISDSLLWVHGSHNYTFGGDYRRQQFNPFSDSDGRGSYTFNGSATSYYVNSVAQSGTGYDLADLLLGVPTTSSIRYGNPGPDKYLRGSATNFFVNNDWRITQRFSLVTGLRWEYASPVTELYNRLANLEISSGYTAVTLVEASSASGVSNALIHPDRNNFSPRLGFAWRLFTKDSTVVRGGYGIYYNTSVYNVVASNMAQQPPFAEALSVSGTTSNPLDIKTAFTQVSTSSTSNTFSIDPNYRIGYAQTWTLSVQHDLPWSMFLTAGYLGTKGTRLDQQFIPNSVAPGATESSLPHSFTYETSNGDSTYHAAQFQLHRRFRSGLMVHANYQLSKSIDNAGTGGRGEGNTPVAQNWLDLAAERGLSSFDARHNLLLNLQYSTGMGASGGTLVDGWKGHLLKDWTVGGSITLHSGNPFSATVGGNRSQVSGTAVSNTVRADATGEPVTAAGSLFNTAAFAEPAAGLWGSAGRNTIPGPTAFSLNGSFGRIFRLGERRSADLQLQAQNLLNHVTITSWGTVVGSTNYGLATGAAAMRKITINLRFRF
jgi:trimeric autotransporter adhesin